MTRENAVTAPRVEVDRGKGIGPLVPPEKMEAHMVDLKAAVDLFNERVAQWEAAHGRQV